MVIFIGEMSPILISPLGLMGVDIILRIIRVCWVGIDRIGCIIVLRVRMLLSWGHETCFKDLGPEIANNEVEETTLRSFGIWHGILHVFGSVILG